MARTRPDVLEEYPYTSRATRAVALELKFNGEPWRARTSDPLIKSAVTGTPAGYGSYDLLTFVTGCNRQRVQLLIPITPSLSVFWSQVGHKPIPRLALKAIHSSCGRNIASKLGPSRPCGVNVF